MPDQYQYEAVVLGGGPGGYETAIRLSQYGKTVALIEAKELGGTCLNRGCIPTKALLHHSGIYDQLNHLPAGLSVSQSQYDYAAIVESENQTVARLRQGISTLLKGYGVTVINGYGRLTSPHSIKVNDTEVTADKIVIATGSCPASLPIPGADSPLVLNSDEFLQLKELPLNWVIIGGGVIGMELATVICQFGGKVTILEMMDRILPGVDDELMKWLQRDLRKKGIVVKTKAKVNQITSTDNSVTVTYQQNEAACEIITADRCLTATGRKPQIGDIGLDKVQLQLDGRYLAVDEQLKTSVDNIYAIGDVTGKPALAHVATAQGMVAAANINGQPTVMNYQAIPACIYTNPEIAWVGVSATQLQKEGRNYEQGVFNILANGRAMIEQASGGCVCVYSDPKTHVILGGQIMAPNATEMIGELTSLITLGQPVEALQRIIHPHPTVAESIQAAGMDILHLNTAALPATGSNRRR